MKYPLIVMNNAFRLLLFFGTFIVIFSAYEYVSQLPGWVKSPRAWSIAGVFLIAAYALELLYKSRLNGERSPKLTAVSKFLPRIAAFCLFMAVLESR